MTLVRNNFETGDLSSYPLAEGELDFEAMSDLSDRVLDCAEKAFGDFSEDYQTGEIVKTSPSTERDRQTLITLADISVRALNTAMIENPGTMSLLREQNYNVVDGINQALVVDPTPEMTPIDLNKAVNNTLDFINGRSRTREQVEFDEKSALSLFKVVYGSMEALVETTKLHCVPESSENPEIRGSVKLYSGLDKIEEALSEYQDDEELSHVPELATV